MQYYVNGKDKISNDNFNISNLLEELGLLPSAVVVEKNREIIERDTYNNTPIKEGDNLELLSFVGGG